MKKYKFFYNGILSNWNLTGFTIGGITYNCGEQYMMHCKALFLKDQIAAEKILKELSPKRQKQLGRDIVSDDIKVWDAIKKAVVKDGLREKLKQNPKVKEYLMRYKGYTFVEASDEDRIWGIGYLEHNAMKNIADWGQNLLGETWTELSSEI